MPLRPLKELVPRRSSRLRSAGALVFHFFCGLPSYVALTAYLADGVGCLLQIFWISHIELLRVVVDGELALRLAPDSAFRSKQPSLAHGFPIVLRSFLAGSTSFPEAG
jgi:hypothetical protein